MQKVERTVFSFFAVDLKQFAQEDFLRLETYFKFRQLIG